MLCYVLQGEVGNCSEQSKIAVANVIINRVKTGRFGSSISDVLTAPNQFTAINGYYSGRNKPTQNTIDCAKRALNGEDNSNGAVYYYAPQYCGGSTAAWFESLTFCMELDGQRYFK
jgi:spore germination cell wall hydrolase CwlJ-like protein